MNIKSYHQRETLWEIFPTLNFSIVLLAPQGNRKIKSDNDFSGRHDQVIVRVYKLVKKRIYICVKMMARHRVFVFVSLSFYFFISSVIKFDKKCANSTQRSHLLRLTVVSAKSKFHSHRRGYLSPGNFTVLEIAAASLVNSDSCRFGGSFIETQARFQQTSLFS